MQRCVYIDISKTQWVKAHCINEHFLEMPLTKQIKIESHVLLIFSDFIPGDVDIPEVVWRLVDNGIKIILVLAEEPRQIESCWALMNKGLADVVVWEGQEPLIRLITTKEERWKKINDVLLSPVVHDNLIGESRQWRNFLGEVIGASIFSRSNILIYGESGTGKELVSRLIHTLDERPEKGKLVLVDCTTVVPELSGSEFFGHEKGSYTSSVSTRDGAFALADKGTLFLDEISELPLTLQAELLRAIQEKSYKRVGSNHWKTSDFRLVCATNKNLEKLVLEGKFRQDLFYRISDIQLSVPALRNRTTDIEKLAEHFLHQFCDEHKISDVPKFDPAVMNFITTREYVGNIRQLRQFIRRIAMRHTGGTYITLGSVPAEERPANNQDTDFLRVIDGWEESIKRAILSGEDLMEIKNIAAYLAIKIAIELERGDKQKAASRLNVTVRAVQQYLKKNPVLN